MSGKCQVILLKNAGSHKNTNKTDTLSLIILEFLQELANIFLYMYPTIPDVY
jgi:hypothetical protein